VQRGSAAGKLRLADVAEELPDLTRAEERGALKNLFESRALFCVVDRL